MIIIIINAQIQESRKGPDAQYIAVQKSHLHQTVSKLTNSNQLISALSHQCPKVVVHYTGRETITPLTPVWITEWHPTLHHYLFDSALNPD